MCACFLRHLLLLYIRRVHGAISGCTVLWEVHPASAQNKSLISDTVKLCNNGYTLLHFFCSVPVFQFQFHISFIVLVRVCLCQR